MFRRACLPLRSPHRYPGQAKQQQGGGDPTANGGTEHHRALRGEQRRANARARELASTTATAGDAVGIREVDPAVLPYVAYGLATPPSKTAGTGVDSIDNSSSSSSSSSAGGSGGARMGAWAKASDRGGDKAGGKSPPVPVPIGGAARPLDSMAELFVNHQMQARRPSAEGAGRAQDKGGSGGGGGDDGVAAPSSTVGDLGARSSRGRGDGVRRDGGVPDGTEATFAASAATVDGRATAGKGGGGIGIIPSGGGIGGGQQLGLEYDGRDTSGGGDVDGDGDSDSGSGRGRDRLEDSDSADADDPRFRRTQSLTTSASAAGLPPTGRYAGSPGGGGGGSPGARSDSEDVQPHAGRRAGRSGRGLAGWRRNFSAGAKKRSGT